MVIVGRRDLEGCRQAGQVLHADHLEVRLARPELPDEHQNSPLTLAGSPWQSKRASPATRTEQITGTEPNVSIMSYYSILSAVRIFGRLQQQVIMVVHQTGDWSGQQTSSGWSRVPGSLSSPAHTRVSPGIPACFGLSILDPVFADTLRSMGEAAGRRY